MNPNIEIRRAWRIELEKPSNSGVMTVYLKRFQAESGTLNDNLQKIAYSGR